MNFKNLKLKKKQLLGFGFVLLILAIVNGYTINRMADLIGEIDEFNRIWLPSAVTVSKLNLATSELRRMQLQYAFAGSESLKKEQAREMSGLIDEINSWLDKYQQLKSEAEKKQLILTEEQMLFSDFERKWDEYQALSFSFFILTRENKVTEAIELLNADAREIFNSFSHDLVKLVNIYQNYVFQVSENAQYTFDATRHFTTLLFIVAIAISIVFTGWLVRMIVRPVQELEQAAKTVAEGNLEVKLNVKSKDEIGNLANSFNSMTAALKESHEKTEQQTARLRLQWEVLSETNSELEQKSKDLEKQKTQIEQKNTELEDTMKKLKETQNQLVQSEKMASVGQLTAGIAHEINNPINFVSSNINPLKRDLQDVFKILEGYETIAKEKGLENQFNKMNELKSELDFSYIKNEISNLLDGIHEGANRTSEIVRGLRNFSRLDEDEQKLADLNQGIESTLLMLRNQLKNRIEVEKNYGNIPQILCFPGKLNQVFMNILSNASHAIGQNGKITITTSTENAHVLISIRDTGKGMSADVIEHIFDPFYTTKDVGEGTGLGLAISYGIIEEHQGSIKVKSEPGKGTEFIIRIPKRQ